MNNYRICFMGTPEFASNVLEELLNNNYNIVVVVSQPDKEVGRKRVLTPSPVKELALKNNIPILQPHKIKNEYEDILKFAPDLIITCAYGQILPKVILDYPKYGCLNIHGSLLPKYRGAAPIQWAIIDGNDMTGITIQSMALAMDEGDILYQKELPITLEDTNSTMFNKLSGLAKKMLLEFLPRYFNNDYVTLKQDNTEATYAPMLKKEDEFISFKNKTLNVYNHIRGLLDNPGAYGILKDKQYKFIKVGYELSDNTDASCFKGLENNYLRIDCEDGFIKVYTLKPEGKNAMDAKAFFNGNGRNLVGDHFNE